MDRPSQIGSSQIGSLLRVGNRRTVGNVAEVVRRVLEQPELIPCLVECLFEDESALRMRAADALEKVSRVRCEIVQSYADVLLNLLEETQQQEIRWHLAVVLPRLRLNRTQCLRAALAMQACMAARSSIVKTFALQGLVDLSAQEPSVRPFAIDLLRSAERSGTPAMKARSRRLLLKFESLVGQ